MNLLKEIEKVTDEKLLNELFETLASKVKFYVVENVYSNESERLFEGKELLLKNALKCGYESYSLRTPEGTFYFDDEGIPGIEPFLNRKVIVTSAESDWDNCSHDSITINLKLL